MSDSAIEKKVKEQFKLGLDSIHGLGHWNRVNQIGFYLAKITNADLRVVSLFSILHDSQRENEDYDPDHGTRAATYTAQLFDAGLLPLNQKQLNQLIHACNYHSNPKAQSDDLTVKTCWDADRLDLCRVGEVPNPKFLYTQPAKQPEARDFALNLLEHGK